MPSGVRLFISHSSAEEDLARDAVRALKERLDARIDVLYDKDVLDTGDHWRDELWNWWAQCDAAVVVCSKAALDSRWVFIEVTMLMRRHGLDGLPIFPILIDPATPADLAGALFHDQQFAELQATQWTAATLDAGADALAAKINALRVLSRVGNPLFEWEAGIAEILKKHGSPEVIAAAAPAVGARLEAWMPSPLKARIVARGLIEAKPSDVKTALCALAKAVDKKRRTDIMNLVAAAWLPPANVTRLAAIMDEPKGKRGVALTTTKASFASWYIRRASASYPTWEPVDVVFKKLVGADDVDEAYDDICASLRKYLHLDPDDDIEWIAERLNAREAKREPVFIVVPADDAEPPARVAAKQVVPLIERLTADFAPLSFFIVVPKEAALAEAVQSGRVVFLQFVDRQQAVAWVNDYAEAIDALSG